MHVDMDSSSPAPARDVPLGSVFLSGTVPYIRAFYPGVDEHPDVLGVDLRSGEIRTFSPGVAVIIPHTAECTIR